MAKFNLFNDFADSLADRKHDLGSPVMRCGFVTAVAAVSQADSEPVWGTYSAYEVSTAGGYPSGGITLQTSWGKSQSGIWTLSLGSFRLERNIAGFTNASHIIVYNASPATKDCVGFGALGGLSEQLADVTITFGGAAVGSLGTAATFTVS